MNKKHELFEILKEVKGGNKMAAEAYDEILLLFSDVGQNTENTANSDLGGGSFHSVLVRYKKWTEENDEDYCHDQVHEFLADLTRGEMISFMDWCLENYH